MMMACPVCGAQPWHVFGGKCAACGWVISRPLPTEFPAPL